MSKKRPSVHFPPVDLEGFTDREKECLYGVARKYVRRSSLSRGVWDSEDVVQAAALGVLKARQSYGEKPRRRNYDSYMINNIKGELFELSKSHLLFSGRQDQGDRRKVSLVPIGDMNPQSHPPQEDDYVAQLEQACASLPEKAREWIGHRYGVLGYPRLCWGATDSSPEMSNIKTRARYWINKLKKSV